jgi:putative phage-type endonuclease
LEVFIMALPNRQLDTRPALRLVDTRTIERAEWLEVRKTGIGGSDAAAAVGLSPYKSPLELWLEKTNRDATLPKPDPQDTTEPVYWGTLLELTSSQNMDSPKLKNPTCFGSW